MTKADREEIEKYIDLAIKRSVLEYKRSGLLKEADRIIYDEISEILSRHFQIAEDPKVTEELEKMLDDRYYQILPMYYKRRRTIEEIADHFGCDRSTVTRNKKRLCLELYAKII